MTAQLGLHVITLEDEKACKKPSAGHAWVSIRENGIVTTFGLFRPPTGRQDQGTDVRKNIEPEMHVTPTTTVTWEIGDEEAKILKALAEKPQKWDRENHNCSHYARDLIEGTVGEHFSNSLIVDNRIYPGDARLTCEAPAGLQPDMREYLHLRDFERITDRPIFRDSNRVHDLDEIAERALAPLSQQEGAVREAGLAQGICSSTDEITQNRGDHRHSSKKSLVQEELARQDAETVRNDPRTPVENARLNVTLEKREKIAGEKLEWRIRTLPPAQQMQEREAEKKRQEAYKAEARRGLLKQQLDRARREREQRDRASKPYSKTPPEKNTGNDGHEM